MNRDYSWLEFEMFVYYGANVFVGESFFPLSGNSADNSKGVVRTKTEKYVQGQIVGKFCD